MNVNEQYTRELRDNLNYSATWLPTVKLHPGDVGRIINYQYEPVGNLNEFSIPFEISNNNVVADIDYASSDAVSITYKASGSMPITGSNLTQAEAGVCINFSRENAVVFQITGCHSSWIANRMVLEQEIINCYKSRDWKEDYVVVTEVVSAKNATILVSSGKDAHMDIRIEADFGSGVMNLANVGTGFQVVQASKLATKVLATRGLTPLFKAVGVKKKFFTNDIIVRGIERTEHIELTDLDYADFA